MPNRIFPELVRTTIPFISPVHPPLPGFKNKVMKKFKTHMVFYHDDDGDFRTGCNISSEDCSESFWDNAKLVAFGMDSKTTCKNCLQAYQRELKEEQMEEQRIKEFETKIDSIAVNSEIFSQPDQMYAEGMYETELFVNDISYFLAIKGYKVTYFQSSYDGLQQCWRWTAKIKKLESALEQLNQNQ